MLRQMMAQQQQGVLYKSQCVSMCARSLLSADLTDRSGCPLRCIMLLLRLLRKAAAARRPNRGQCCPQTAAAAQRHVKPPVRLSSSRVGQLTAPFEGVSKHVLQAAYHDAAQHRLAPGDDTDAAASLCG